MILIIGAGIGYLFSLEVHYADQVSPAGMTQVSDFLRRFGNPQWVQMVHKNGQSYYELRGWLPSGPARLLASSLPAYVFDQSGRFVTWCKDPGDMPSYREEWPLEVELRGNQSDEAEIWTMKARPNQPDRANRRQPLGLRERVGNVGVIGFTAAVAHPGR